MLDQYQTDGYVILRQQIPEPLVENARREAYAMHEAVGGRFGEHGAYTHHDGTQWHRKRVHGLSAVAPILQHLPVHDLLGPGDCGITHSKFSYKQVGEVQNWAPHQDAVYKPEPRRGAVFAIPLEPVDVANGTLELLPKSHLRGHLPHRNVTDSAMNGQLELVEPVEGFVPVVAQPGDVAAFSLLTVHRSGPNTNRGLRVLLFVEVEPMTELLRDENGGPITVI
jgi:ectoine hydroxylase-related dioxygenase (phytanoyl-CoA dioxygenase family)